MSRQVNGIPYKEFVAPGLIASAAMWSAAFETTYNVYFRMNELRLYDNVLSTPVEVQDLVAGDLAWSATRATLYGTVFLVVVAAFGLVSSPWAILIPPFVVARRPLLLGDRLHVHVTDPEDRPVQLLLHARDHADVPVLGHLLPVRSSCPAGSRWSPG